jgi:hypothetical protein
MPLQPRHGYAADVHRGLRIGDLNRPRSSPRRHGEDARCDPAHIRQVGAGGLLLRGVQPLVSHVHLPVSLAGPRPSGSAGPSRRCRGCLPPSPASPGSDCPQLLPTRCDEQAAEPVHPARSEAPRGARSHSPRPGRAGSRPSPATAWPRCAPWAAGTGARGRARAAPAAPSPATPTRERGRSRGARACGASRRSRPTRRPARGSPRPPPAAVRAPPCRPVGAPPGSRRPGAPASSARVAPRAPGRGTSARSSIRHSWPVRSTPAAPP